MRYVTQSYAPLPISIFQGPFRPDFGRADGLAVCPLLCLNENRCTPLIRAVVDDCVGQAGTRKKVAGKRIAALAAQFPRSSHEQRPEPFLFHSALRASVSDQPSAFCMSRGGAGFQPASRFTTGFVAMR